MFMLRYGSRLPGLALSRCPRLAVATIRSLQYSTTDIDDSTVVPWYLRIVEEEKKLNHTLLPSQEHEITFPPNTTESLRDICKFLQDDLYLSDIKIFDLQRNKDIPIKKICQTVILATSKSVKHAQFASMQLNKLIKSQFKVVPHIEGCNTKNITNIKKYRSKKRSMENSINADEAWILMDLHVESVFLNIMTPKKRSELNLEELYDPEYKKIVSLQNDEPIAIDHEDNILIGLRNLARQRKRNYSTISASKEFVSLLRTQDFPKINNYLTRFKPINTLDPLKSIVSTLSNMQQDTSVDIENWKMVFDSFWPLVVISPDFWQLRFKFLTLLNVANPEIYHCRRFFNDYFKLKAYMGCELMKNEIISFLNVLVENKAIAGMTATNEIVSDLLYLMEKTNLDQSIIFDTEIIRPLLHSTIKKDGTGSSSFYEVVYFMTDTRGGFLTSKTLLCVLEMLLETRNYDIFFETWVKCIPLFSHNCALWESFIKLVVASNDLKVMEKMIIDNHLLLLKRNNVSLTQSLKLQIHRLFEAVDQKDTKFTDFKNYMLDLDSHRNSI
ncbi:hypothetical protein KAFR_0A00660 [Kazachstania africana CBS 2517]|uniref:ATPase synthesis protein 25 n=1 Tax=Kazachstania africana (strain ATCC 22294 / BCRC 22015 / CBS 2517 / CECT 1963 / NBRC 1671 / NRRL Y-8276) TaxID=1071382 RepID=H2AMA4_KAZAF|nr:hypothetical protein KAFR_0A00660 [Kazachstania africana CBS 2517]CCF55504.1 hypothetical protein KAFR_0A00660 [Kazachstania africana CBS 2517]